MSKDELQIASRSIKELLIKIPKRPFRRSENSYLGKEVSTRESLRRAKRNFGSVIPKLVKKKEVSRPVIVLIRHFRVNGKLFKDDDTFRP